MSSISSHDWKDDGDSEVPETSSTPTTMSSVLEPGTEGNYAVVLHILLATMSLLNRKKLQAFNLPPQLYYLGPEYTKPLELKCRSHFNLHAEFIHASEPECEALEMAKQFQGRAKEIHEQLVIVSVELDGNIDRTLIHFNSLRQVAQKDSSAPKTLQMEPSPCCHCNHPVSKPFAF